MGGGGGGALVATEGTGGAVWFPEVGRIVVALGGVVALVAGAGVVPPCCACTRECAPLGVVVVGVGVFSSRVDDSLLVSSFPPRPPLLLLLFLLPVESGWGGCFNRDLYCDVFCDWPYNDKSPFTLVCLFFNASKKSSTFLQTYLEMKPI